MNKGIFIVFDGPEGAGKSTQLRILAESFRSAKYEVVETVEPGGTNAGMKIRELLLDPAYPLTSKTESLLFSAARAQVVAEIIRPNLAAGKVVLCDRFAASTFAYQGFAGEVFIDDIVWLTDFSAEELTPDLLLIFDIDPVVGFLRKRGAGADRIEKKSLDFHQKVRQGFLMYAQDHHDYCIVLDADCPEEEMSARIIEVINAWFDLSLSATI